MRKVVVIAPTYNEKGSIEILIKKIFEQEKKIKNWEINVLVVDSKSTDGTIEIVKKLQKSFSRLYLLETEKEGLGKAYIQGFKFCQEKLNPYLIIDIDADGQHDPSVINQFIKKIEEGADFVIGTRYSKGGSIPKNWAFYRKFLSISASLIMRLGFMKPKITDWTSGYRAIKFWLVKNAFDHIKNYSGYVFQIAFLDFAIKNNAIIAEVPIVFEERKLGKSKINAFQYISQSFIYLFTHSSFIKFFIVGLIGFFIDFTLIKFFDKNLKIPSSKFWLAQIISAEAAIISNFLFNNFWSFNHKKLKNNFILGFLKFNFVSLGSILIQTTGLQIAVNIFGRSYWEISKIAIIILIIIPYSYILYNKFIWKNK